MKRSAPQMLREFRAPDEPGAERRAWDVVAAAYAARQPVRRRPSRVRLAVVPALAVLAAGVLLSPAGAAVSGLGGTVSRLITKALGVRHAAPMLSSLPSPGQLLVSSPGGTWTVAADGSLRRLGSWSQASWSPRGLYVAVASRDRLAAVDPSGEVQWAVTRPDVSDPTWFSPSGYRIAYLSAGSLRVIAGDGTNDHLLAARVAQVAPAWRPNYSFQLAYVTVGNRIVVREADPPEQILWTAPAGARARELLWSSDGRRLVVVAAHAVRTYTPDGVLRTTLRLPSVAAAGDAALSPDGRQLALVLGGRQLAVVSAGASNGPVRQLLGVAGLRELSWSPNGQWLLVSLPEADQWVFVRALGTLRVAAVGSIARQFLPGSSPVAYPRPEGWCCTIQGPAG